MTFISKPLGLAFTILLGILGLAAAPGPAPRVPAGHSGASTPRRVARLWVDAVDGGDARAACELQTVAEVAGKPCEALQVAGEVFYCPEIETMPGRRHLDPAEQVRRVVRKGRHAAATIVSRVQPDGFRSLLGLTRHDGRWQVAWFDYGGRRLRPAGLAFEGQSPVNYRLAPPCE